MIAIVGTMLITAGTMLFSWSVIEYRRPSPPRWATQENYAIAFSMIITACFSLGTASYVRMFLLDMQKDLNSAELGFIAVVYACLVIFVIAMRRRWNKLSAEAPSAATRPQAAAPGTPT